MITHRCACESFLISIIITSITWAGPRCVQEMGNILGPQNRTHVRCVLYNVKLSVKFSLSLLEKRKAKAKDQVTLADRQ